RFLLPWIVAQCVGLLLWIPWLPVFWRQATDPPVPPWRTPWETGTQILTSLAESASALISGQSAPNTLAWYWILCFLAILFTANLHYTKNYAIQPFATTAIGRYGLLIGYLL